MFKKHRKLGLDIFLGRPGGGAGNSDALGQGLKLDWPRGSTAHPRQKPGARGDGWPVARDT
jgi:hypothetical protein